MKFNDDGMSFERIISVLLTNIIKTKTVNGNIHRSKRWGSAFLIMSKTKNLILMDIYQVKNEKYIKYVWVGNECNIRYI